MIYVIETSSWQQLFGCYRRERFPTLWEKFDETVASGAITSIQHVLREIERRDKKNGELEWARTRPELFPGLNENESRFLRDIFEVPRFRLVVPTDLRDTEVGADPYLIARAKAIGGMVITQERRRNSRVTIPSICQHFEILCGSLDDFMNRRNWSF